jgi:quercetin dioxygenase-like cupin family protein
VHREGLSGGAKGKPFQHNSYGRQTLEEKRPLPAFTETPGTSNSRWFMGALLTFLATGKKTGGQFSLFEATVRKDYEVPPHTHSREDESFYVLEGELVCMIGDGTYPAKAGDFVFLPRNVQHSWRSVTEPARFLVLINPAGSEEVFLEFSEPAPALELPPVTQGPPDEAFMERIVAMDNEYGVMYAFQTESAQ